MTKLSVNINKIATIRNARGGDTPNIVQVAVDCERYGAEGITVHPRPDERHITRQDVYDLANVIQTELNIEGFPDKRFVDLISDVKPQQATLVPDPPNVLTSNAGWDTVTNQCLLADLVQQFREKGVRISLFVDTNLHHIEHAAKTGTDRIELYTGPFADHFSKNPEAAICDYVKAANFASELGLEINAGHDLNLDNLQYFKSKIPNLLEVSIGHALISDALYLGLENTIQRYKQLLID
jgi:pyridoxine 5-phosphate synthase